jgi:esterase/lipase
MVRMQMANHILAKEGILTTFSIAKKVTAKDVKKLRERMKSAKIDADKLNELLKKAVVKEAQTSIESQHIPGLIVPGAEENEEKKRIMELTYFASVVAKKLSEKRVGKYHSCYIINAIVNMLGLTEEDFDEFHKKFSKFREGDNSPD